MLTDRPPMDQPVQYSLWQRLVLAVLWYVSFAAGFAVSWGRSRLRTFRIFVAGDPDR